LGKRHVGGTIKSGKGRPRKEEKGVQTGLERTDPTTTAGRRGQVAGIESGEGDVNKGIGCC